MKLKFAYNFKRFLLLAILDSLASEPFDDYYQSDDAWDNIGLLDKLTRSRFTLHPFGDRSLDIG